MKTFFYVSRFQLETQLNLKKIFNKWFCVELKKMKKKKVFLFSVEWCGEEIFEVLRDFFRHVGSWGLVF